MRALARRIRYALWTLNGYIGRTVSLDVPQKATVLITYYNPARTKHIEPQVRNIAKCNFVDRIVVSSHNPEIQIADKVKFRDDRLVFRNQVVRRGCGYRWSVANEFDLEYLIVLDDDILLFPWQLAKLFRHLVSEPGIPHGLSGMLQPESGELEYYARENMSVDYLCETYAVTKDQLERYAELEKLFAGSEALTAKIQSAVDFMVISQTGSYKPKIHNVGRISRCPTFEEVGVAVHKEAAFGESMQEVGGALRSVIEQAAGQPVDVPLV